jgi:hypothetical protein
MKFFVHLVTLLLISSCGSALDDRIFELVEGKNKWMESAPNKSYLYTYVESAHKL